MAKYRVKLNKDKCIGCGSCVAVCPEVFEMSADGKAEIKTTEIEELGCARTAEEICPVKVIEIALLKEE